MHVGMCWPQRHEDLPIDVGYLQKVADVQVHDLRMDFDHRRTDGLAWIDAVRDVGLELLPIIDGDRALFGQNSSAGNDEINRIVGYAQDLHVKRGLTRFEISNEPMIAPNGHPIPPNRYADLVRAFRRGLPTATLAMGAEGSQPIAFKRDYYEQVIRQLAPSDWDVWSVHPYHNPGPPTQSPNLRAQQLGRRPSVANTLAMLSSWWRWSREDEHREIYERRAQGKVIWWTEALSWAIGSGRSKNTEEQQERYIIQELDLAKQLGIPRVYFYAHHGETSLWREDGTKRPAHDAMRDWILANAA